MKTTVAVLTMMVTLGSFMIGYSIGSQFECEVQESAIIKN